MMPRPQLQRNHCLLTAGAVQGTQHGNRTHRTGVGRGRAQYPVVALPRDGDRRPVHIKLLQLKRQQSALSGRHQLVQLALEALEVLLPRCALGESTQFPPQVAENLVQMVAVPGSAIDAGMR